MNAITLTASVVRNLFNEIRHTFGKETGQPNIPVTVMTAHNKPGDSPLNKELLSKYRDYADEKGDQYGILNIAKFSKRDITNINNEAFQNLEVQVRIPYLEVYLTYLNCRGNSTLEKLSVFLNQLKSKGKISPEDLQKQQKFIESFGDSENVPTTSGESFQYFRCTQYRVRNNTIRDYIAKVWFGSGKIELYKSNQLNFRGKFDTERRAVRIAMEGYGRIKNSMTVILPCPEGKFSTQEFFIGSAARVNSLGKPVSYVVLFQKLEEYQPGQTLITHHFLTKRFLGEFSPYREFPEVTSLREFEQLLAQLYPRAQVEQTVIRKLSGDYECWSVSNNNHLRRALMRIHANGHVDFKNNELEFFDGRLEYAQGSIASVRLFEKGSKALRYLLVFSFDIKNLNLFMKGTFAGISMISVMPISGKMVLCKKEDVYFETAEYYDKYSEQVIDTLESHPNFLEYLADTNDGFVDPSLKP